MRGAYLDANIQLSNRNRELKVQVEQLREENERLKTSCELKAKIEDEETIKQLQAENVRMRERVDSVLNLHVEGREFMTSSQLYEAVIQDCTEALNSIPETDKVAIAAHFANHIENHLSDDQEVMCKICNKTISEIWEERER